MDPATATADSFNTTSPLAAPNRMRARMLIAAALALVGCRLIGAWHSVAGMAAACMVMAALAIGVVSISPRLRYWMFYLLLPLAVAANAAMLAAGSCLACMGNQGLLPGGRLGMKAPWPPLFWCVPLAAALSLWAFAKVRGSGVRNRHGMALAANLIIILFALWYWAANVVQAYSNSAPPLGAVLLMTGAAISFATLIWDAPRPAAASTPGRRQALGRIFLITTLTVPIVTAIIAAFLPLYRHRQTIAELESLGFDWEPGRVPRWARKMKGYLPVYDFLADVEVVYLRRTGTIHPADAERIEHLFQHLPGLWSLSINNVPPGLGRLLRPPARRRWLTLLALTGPEVTDEALTDIAALPGLTSLSVSHSRITDDGLAELAKVPSLEAIDLSGTNISGKGLAKLASSPRLWALDLADVPIDDSDLKALERYPALRMVNLRGTRVTDEGISRLRQALPLLGAVHETLGPMVPGAGFLVPVPAAPGPGVAPQPSPTVPPAPAARSESLPASDDAAVRK